MSKFIYKYLYTFKYTGRETDCHFTVMANSEAQAVSFVEVNNNNIDKHYLFLESCVELIDNPLCMYNL